MRSPRLFSITSSAILLSALCSSAFAWSISGTVVDKATNAPIAGADIATFNIGGCAQCLDECSVQRKRLEPQQRARQRAQGFHD